MSEYGLHGYGHTYRHDSAHASAHPVAAESFRPVYAFLKRATDFVAALILFIGSLPLMLVAMLLVKGTSSGPAIYSQKRLGRGGRTFAIYKIRTMVHNCEKASGIRWCVPGDPRVTPVGRFLRRTHLDELPELWNVLRGDMSLIGPRPERPEFLPELEAAIPGYRGRLQIRPGLSGLAQVQLPPDTDLESVRRKLRYDLYYVAHASLWLDCRLMLGTIGYLLHMPLGPVLGRLKIPGRPLVEQALPASEVREGRHPAPVQGLLAALPESPESRLPGAAILAEACNP